MLSTLIPRAAVALLLGSNAVSALDLDLTSTSRFACPRQLRVHTLT